ncbi:MAG TPA: DUF3035 domain-containing protein [Alphaproteobacteria bacterium]|nr:DUF3035 domain-containing protein [Alphaproteobacteria bacterium]
MNVSRLILVSALSVSALMALSACGDMREGLGLGRSPPDEFAVVDRPPLSMPPDFGLRPPKPGAPRPQEVDLNQRANETLFGDNSKAGTSEASADTSGAEKALLDQTGATKADPNIREIVERENSDKVAGNDHLIQQLMWWKEDEKPGTVVDPVAEAERIKEAKDKGTPINQGATPVIEHQKSGWLGL